MDFSNISQPRKIDKSEEVGSSQRAIIQAVVHNVVPTLNRIIDWVQRLKAHVGANESSVEALEDRVSALERELEEAEGEEATPTLEALSKPTRDALEDAGITDVEALRRKTDDELSEVDGIGASRLEEIRDVFPTFD